MEDDCSQIWQSPLRILIVDNDLDTARINEILLEKWDYHPIVATGKGLALLEDARQKAQQHRCQLALVDLRLIDDLDEDDKSGLDLATQIKPTLTILLSGYATVELATESIETQIAISILRKGGHPQEIQKKIEMVAQRISARYSGLRIGPPALIQSLVQTLFAPNLSFFYRDQLLDTLARLFPDARGLELEKLDQGSTTSFAEIPRPRSVILQVSEDGLQPVIVKLARAHKVGIEVQRYNRYVDRRLLGQAAPNISKTELLWDIGGIKFVYNGTIRKNFEHLYKSKNIKTIRQTLEHFFKHTWSNHYAKARKVKNISLLRLYRRVLDDDWLRRIENFPPFNPETSMGKERWQMLGASNPLDWFRQRILDRPDDNVGCAEETFVAVTHGDLHAGNILIDDANKAWVIDFERTRVGHILQDFIELESDLINRMLPGSESFPLYHRLCFSVTAPQAIGPLENNFDLTDPASIKLIQTISIIRSLAKECTNLTDIHQYLVGLLFNTLFRATIIKETETLSELRSQHRALMLASIICHRLDHWGESWPPENWLHLNIEQDGNYV